MCLGKWQSDHGKKRLVWKNKHQRICKRIQKRFRGLLRQWEIYKILERSRNQGRWEGGLSPGHVLICQWPYWNSISRCNLSPAEHKWTVTYLCYRQFPFINVSQDWTNPFGSHIKNLLSTKTLRSVSHELLLNLVSPILNSYTDASFLSKYNTLLNFILLVPQCYGWEECPPEVHVSKVWSQAWCYWEVVEASWWEVVW